MTEPRRSTRARAREEAAPPTPETTNEKPAKGPKSTLKRKRPSVAVKDSAPGTPVAEASQQPSKPVLPLRIAEGQPLPTLPEPQPLELPSAEWQNIQQSGVLSASLQRSRAVWVSGVNFRTFHKKYTMPKKVSERTEADKQAKARQKEIEKNFPQVGAMDAQLVIEPHTFPIKLYAPKEGSRAAPKKMAPPQQYGAWPNHSQHSQHPPQYQPYGQAPYPPKPPPQSRPPPPKPIQHASPQTAPGPASTPAPDPVIHMLAARAGTDPELKAVMKIVAAGQAGKEQLEFFQKHINELTEILEKQKKSKATVPIPHIPAASPAPSKQQAPSPAPPKQQARSPSKQAPSPAPSKERTPSSAAVKGQDPSPAPSLQQAPSPAPAPAKQQTPAATPAKQSSVPAASPAPSQPKQQLPTPTPPPPRPAMPPQQQPQAPPKIYNPAPPPLQQHRPPPPQARPPPPNTYPVKNYNQPPYYSQPPPHYAPQQPPRITYRPLTFEFVEGNGDRFYFPSYSFMEWLPNGSGAKFSFLVTKLKPKPEDTAAAAKPPSTPATPAPPQTPTPASAAPTPAGAPAPTPSTTTTATAQPNPPPHFPPPTPATPATPSYTPPPRIEDFDDRSDIPSIALYQPVTVLVLTDEHDVKSALPRAIRPPSEVNKYMEEVFDACERAGETYLAFRLPREGVDGLVVAESEGATPMGMGTPGVDEGRVEGEREKRRKSGAAGKRKSVVGGV